MRFLEIDMMRYEIELCRPICARNKQLYYCVPTRRMRAVLMEPAETAPNPLSGCMQDNILSGKMRVVRSRGRAHAPEVTRSFRAGTRTCAHAVSACAFASEPR